MNSHVMNRSLASRSPDEVEDYLQDLTVSLPPPRAWKRKARQVMKDVFQILQQNSQFSLDRCRIVGSVAKGTSTSVQLDLDACIYYNEEVDRPPVLADWRNVLVSHTNLRRAKIRETEFLLGFVFRDIHIDLVAVPNRVIDNSQGDVAITQLREDLKVVRRSEDPMEEQKTLTLSIQSVKWMKQREPLCREMGLIAKYWVQMIPYDRKVWGKSYIFELVAVAAAEEELRRARVFGDDESYVRAFRGFLEKVRDLKMAKIIFKSCLYRPNEVPSEVRSQIPLLLNPVNPYQNLLDMPRRVADHFLTKFSRCAESTLRFIPTLN